MDRNQVILEYLKASGPSLPVDVAKATNQDVLFASAILSTLSNQNLAKASNKKIGSSTLYYISGQEDKVREMIYPRLNEREKQLIEKIGKAGFVKESELSPPERFFARELKDFLESQTVSGENYWKHYNHEGNIIQEQKAEVTIEEIKPQAPVKEEARVEVRVEAKKEVVKEQKVLDDIKPIKLDRADDEFTSRVKDFFIKRKIRILEKTVVRSGSESNLIVEVQSDLMPQKYFVKARKKASINEKDLGMAWFEGQKHNMPLVYISDGNLSKKGKEFMDNFGENFKFVKVKL